jgi:glycogen phosphorylase
MRRLIMGSSNSDIFFVDKMRHEIESLEEAFAEHMEYSQIKDRLSCTELDSYKALSLSIRDRLIRKWLRTLYEYKKSDVKKICYFSMEFLMGRLLGNILTNLGLYEKCYDLLRDIGYSLENIRDFEPDMGLGNGGLGRLAACFLDSMATLELPAIGYGIRYEFGIFRQELENGYQIEKPDHWLSFGNPWEIVRPELLYRIKFNGKVHSEKNKNGKTSYKWVDTEDVMALAYDIPIPGFNNNTVNNLRLWQARATNQFDFNYFNSGDYVAAVESKNNSENISKVLYPNDNFNLGKILRLKQEYFFVSASIQDIIAGFKKSYDNFDCFPDKIAIQINDTHPAIGIPELMRILMDEEELEWEHAWEITRKTFSYTNHTVMPEALEKWSLSIFEKLLPRHLQIIYEINNRFLKSISNSYTNDPDTIARMSIIGEGGDKRIRMANLSVVGSHAVNGVSELHTEILKSRVFPEYNELGPGKFINMTNGITPRRWLMEANPMLSGVISDRIGFKWLTDLYELRKIEGFLNDDEFKEQWRQAKWVNKNYLIDYIKSTGDDIQIRPEAMFDVQVKRIHEYKRQLMNVLHIITLYNKIKDNPLEDFVPRLVLFGGKAAPGYYMAKLIIKLINTIGEHINNDPEMKGKLQVKFLSNYSVSLAEKIIPASDLSEQISTAGFEASGTGNMKFALNGALTIGTLDGANIEIMEEVGEENIFIFGLKADEIVKLKEENYNPEYYYYTNENLKRVLDMLKDDYFNKSEPGIFKPIFETLVHRGDLFCLLADYESYVKKQEEVSEAFANIDLWTRKSILNVARMGKFSSDVTVKRYADKIWNVKPVPIKMT